MGEPDESARAPMRAHILASINPFMSNSANGDDHRTDHKRRPGRRRRTYSSERAHSGADENAEAAEAGGGDHLRPRTSKMRFKSKRPQERVGDDDDSRRTRYRSRDYETDSDRGRDTVIDRDTKRSGYSSRLGVGDDATLKECLQDSTHHEVRSKEEGSSRRRHHRRRRHHHGRHHMRTERSLSRSRSRSPASADGRRDKKRHHRRSRRDDNGREQEEEDPYADPPLDPDAAFRQSLFDAMADDEGAAYWEAVYGQPVHEYAEEAKAYQQPAGSGGSTADPDGLSAMNDDEYADYVRRRMWERSDEGRRETREQQKKQQAAAAAAEKERIRAKQRAFEQDRRHWDEVERSLRRGEARKKRRLWQDRWQTYTSAWSTWEASPSPGTIPWPVERDKAPDTDGKGQEEAFAKEVRAFFTGGPQDGAHYDDDDDDDDEKLAPTTEKSLLARLRDERVRWHPDKMQQRLGGRVDAMVMRDITAIFQVVDRLWSELREKK
ncbi:uncharacterized protein SPSK_07479 [Sporothrix schenckii 1099-18]|uniref:J domain-containing protein n=2 Tax=Sporothrix schenckii TaxID=29908 RepID=U7Q2W7_SPOS1|nr:uncharacterized protein SPSK_07479 [Sporothrix schenckii 1099-18]ERT01502.1 hypothetical protein HMPREF1624_02753 [Sporothrix schenckii ATCC 58251]KJR88702.1 hypothetical protein SPSK_07479 [Sporothrix schenckii 1099-18]